MILRDDLRQYLNELLEIKLFADYCPNGLQVEGKKKIETIVTGVSACQALLDAAVAKNADAILVHHGYFWKNELQVLTGIKRARLKTLLSRDINLFGYHLPLDAHPVYGNNAQLAKILNLQVLARLDHDAIPRLFYLGKPSEGKVLAEDFADRIEHCLGRKPLHITGSKRHIEKIMWCTGAAQNYIDQAIDQHVDAYLTGEVSEQTVHAARESGIHFYAAGHHATERYGIKALGEHLQQRFGLAHHFIDIDNPA